MARNKVQIVDTQTAAVRECYTSLHKLINASMNKLTNDDVMGGAKHRDYK